MTCTYFLLGRIYKIDPEYFVVPKSKIVTQEKEEKSNDGHMSKAHGSQLKDLVVPNMRTR
jgi:hypothetical protein